MPGWGRSFDDTAEPDIPCRYYPRLPPVIGWLTENPWRLTYSCIKNRDRQLQGRLHLLEKTRLPDAHTQPRHQWAPHAREDGQ